MLNEKESGRRSTLHWVVLGAILALLLSVAPALAASADGDAGAGQGVPPSGMVGGDDPPAGDDPPPPPPPPGGGDDPPPPPPPPPGDDDPPPPDPNARTIPVLVELERLEDQSAVIASLDPEDADVRVRYERFPLLALTVNRDALAMLEASSLVVSVDEEAPIPAALHLSVPSIEAYPLHSRGFNGSGMAVAVLDTGIDRDHPFLADAIVAEACFSGGSSGNMGQSLCPTGTGSQTGPGAADAETPRCLGVPDACTHGTHVAGIAAGGRPFVTYPGVAPEAGIIAIQVFTRFNSAVACGSPAATPCLLSWPSDQILALEHVLGLAGDSEIAAVNLSLGGSVTYDNSCDTEVPGYTNAIDELLAAGIPTVIAAGNEYVSDEVSFPGCISTAVTVGATNSTWPFVPAEFSNRGDQLDLFAPGSGIISSLLGEDPPPQPPAAVYGPLSGTSMAAPHVAGALAVLGQAFPNVSLDYVVEVLINTGRAVTYDTDVGWVTTPRIDLFAAYRALDGT